MKTKEGSVKRGYLTELPGGGGIDEAVRRWGKKKKVQSRKQS